MEIFNQIFRIGKYFLLITVFISSLYSQQISLVYPKSAQVISQNDLNLIWDEDLSSNAYDITISTDRNFSSFQVYFSSNNSYLLNTNSYNSWVYWKVKSTNLNYSLADSFFVFRPSSFPNCKAWFDPDSLVKTSNVNLIDTLFDLSGNSNHAFQTVNLQKPQMFIESKFQKKMLLFSGQQALLFPLTASSNYHFFAFCSPGQNKGYNETILSSSFASGARWAIGVGYSVSDGCGWGGATGNLPLSNTNHINSSQYYLLNYSKNVSDWNIKTNSSFIRTVPDPSFPNYSGNHFWNIGSESGYNPLDGNTGTIIIYDRDLTNDESTIVENYFYNKYAPPVNLGANINHLNSFCNDSLYAGSIYVDYLWSTGQTTRSIGVNSSGKVWVRVTDYFGRVSSDTISIVKSIPYVNPLNQTILCNGSTLIWNTNLPKNQFTFQWQNNSTDSILNITQAGNYYVKITDSYNCSNTTNTITVTQDNFSAIASLGPDNSVCAGNAITLTSGANPTNTYLWNDGSTTPSLTITTTGQYSVVVTNTNNCVARDTINITILGQAPVANFSSTLGCKNNQINFTNLSIPPMGNIISNSEWNFGNLPSPSTSTLTNSFHTYSDTGSYTVKLTVFTDSGCKETITKTIHIAPTPSVNFSAGVSCQKDSTAFSNQSISSPGYSITAYNWNFGDMSSGSSLQNPKHVFSNQQNYNVKLVVTNNAGCKDSLTNVVSVKAQVSASFTNSPACSNTAIIFQDNSIVPTPSSSSIRSWMFGVTPKTGITVPMLYTLSGVYPVTLTVTGQNGCVSKISKLISVFNPPVVSFPVASFCSKDTISIANSSTAQSGIISSYNWKLNNTTFSTVQSPTLTSASAGTYSVRLTVVNSFGCKDSLTNPITVFPLPNVDFTTNPLSYYYIDSPVTFSPSIANANSYLWNISNFSPISIASPTVNFTTEGDYVVSLFLTNQQGCKNTKTKNITVSKRYLDLAILNVRTTKDANGFISVEADIANGGSVPINSIDINYQISDAGNIKETWNGTINPNAFYVYSFTAKSASNKSGTSNNITCVNIEKVNGQIDQNTSNNSLCNSLNTDAISVANPVPNPTSSDITLPVILNKDNEITITIYNSTGQVQYAETTQNGILGLNFITLPTDNYAKGCYIIKTVIDDEIFIKKFIKISNE